MGKAIGLSHHEGFEFVALIEPGFDGVGRACELLCPGNGPIPPVPEEGSSESVPLRRDCPYRERANSFPTIWVRTYRATVKRSDSAIRFVRECGELSTSP
jgi:hypothetical protein